MATVEFTNGLVNFCNNIYGQLTDAKSSENIVFSPFSIQTCAAMARLGAENETAQELDRGLVLVSRDVNEIAEQYYKVLNVYEKSNVLHIANKIYVMKGYTVRKVFNELLVEKFFSGADEIDFKQSTAANTINSWVESKTNNLITNLVPSGALNGLTRLVLLNAIHFKGEWKHQFSKRATRDEDFYLNDTESVKIKMMNIKNSFRFAIFPELEASALELPYKDCDLSMLVILPNSRTGLKNLELKLKSMTLNQISQKMFSREVVVKLPKFKVEFQIELSETFKKLGMTRMFTNDAEFGNMLESTESVKVSSIIHKAYIDVNEEGTEAAAATAMFMNFAGPSIRPPPVMQFFADKPFRYVLKNSNNVILFAGCLQHF